MAPEHALQRLAWLSKNILKRWSPTEVKRVIWDGEFSSGRWDYLRNSQGDIVYSYLERYVLGGDILELGCGPGSTACELPDGAYRQYVGVDISPRAIATARARLGSSGGSPRTTFVVADLTRYEPSQRFDVILFRESLYYVPPYAVKRLLERYARHLTPRGVFVVRMYDGRKFRLIVRVLEGNYRVLERYQASAAGTILHVLAPRSSARTH